MSQATSNFILTGDSTDAVRAFRRAGEEYQRLLRQVRSAGVPKTGAGLPDRRTKQYKAIEQWIKDGGKLASTLPVTNERVTDVWQWPISVPEGEMG